MSSLTQLEKDRDEALKKFEESTKRLKSPADLTTFNQLAQNANDDWLDFRQKEIAYTNHVVLKQMGDLYGC